MAETKKATKAKTSKAKAKKLEEPTTREKSITEAALEAASEEQEIINEKRETAGESVEAADSEILLDAALTETDENAPAAKAGKRSSKAQREAAVEAERLARKTDSGEAEDTTPKQGSKPTRSRLERRGKGIRKSAEKIEHDKAYTLEEAIKLAKTTSHVKFDATVELHINLNVDPRHADQNVRDNLVLPAGTGKSVTIAVLTDDAAAAKKAGADITGNDDLLLQLEKGKFDFDILIATPQLMPKLGKYARILGPRGLMPNPKSGTVTTDINKAIAEAKAGRIEYRVDSTGIVHLGVGKVSFSETQLTDNIQAVLASIKSNKPQSVKSNYFKAVHMTTTMGPSITVDLASIN
jgi:large subunit ribosomal protein L1